MAGKMAAIGRRQAAVFLIRTLNLTSLRRISSSLPRLQELQLVDSSGPSEPSPLPPSPSSGSPLYHDSNWRSPNFTSSASLLAPLGVGLSSSSISAAKIHAFSQTLETEGLMNVYSDWTATGRWSEMRHLFEHWVRSLDANGKPNRPNVDLFNHYLWANHMLDSTAGELLDLVAQMEEYEISPNTASYNIVLKAMHKAQESEAAQKLLDRMMQTGTSSNPNDESYNMVIELLISQGQLDSSLKYIDLALKDGRTLSNNMFITFVRRCIDGGKLNELTSVVEKCKNMDQNKALIPPWGMANRLAEAAIQADHSKLCYYALESLCRWISRGENAGPPATLAIEEGLVVSILGVAARTYNTVLLDASWEILRRSLRGKRLPIPETYLGKIHAYANLGNLQRAFNTLSEFETAYGGSPGSEDLFSPLTSLHPLVVACCKKGFSTLDTVYFQLENLSRADKPYKSVAALNCVVLGCGNIWDLDRAYQTFEAISGTFGLTPDIHSYNALMSAFGKLKKTFEASRVFEHMTSLGVKPNSTTYQLLIEAHLMNKDQKAALAVVDEMAEAGFSPDKELLRKIRRRCVRELDFDSNDKVESLARKLSYRLGSENRRAMLFNLDYSMNYA
ncbi:tetratricopeptide repeat (TPR)-like superfamily protein [Wolffia australiana]